MSKKLYSINIKGSDYVPVNDRIKYFREHFPGYGIHTDLLSNQDGVCVIRASIVNPKGQIVSQGLATEKEGSTFINKTSYLENCETSAVGRALGNFGIGIDDSVCSADELVNAINNQEDFDISKAKERLSECETIQDINDLMEEIASSSATYTEKNELRPLCTERVKQLKEAKDKKN